MQIEVLHNLSELEPYAQEWNDLLNRSTSQVPFLRHEYLTAWWPHLGGGEWPQGELHVVVVRQEDGNLLGVAPLFFTENLDGEPALMFIGSIEISDYLDVITTPENTGLFLEALLEHLDSPQAPDWKVLDLYNLLDSSPTLPALESLAEKRTWDCQQEQLQPCPYIPLEGDWEAYLAGIDKRQRKELRRKMRRAENHFIPVNWYVVEDEATLDDDLEAFFELMLNDPLKQAFLTDNMKTQMRTIAHAALKAGWLKLTFMEVGREKAAAQMSFDFANRIWGYNSGLDLKFSDLAPGVVLVGHLLQQAIEQNREVFDFMRGDEEYKYRFGAVNRFVNRITLRR